jgi:hypothetical protein
MALFEQIGIMESVEWHLRSLSPSAGLSFAQAARVPLCDKSTDHDATRNQFFPNENKSQTQIHRIISQPFRQTTGILRRFSINSPEFRP